MKIKKTSLPFIIIFLYFLLERATFTLLGGTFRVYFFISICVIFILLYRFLRLLKYRTSAYVVFYLLTQVIAAALCNSPKAALINVLSTALYVLTAYAVASLICTEKISAEIQVNGFQQILFAIVMFGLFQFVLYQLTGIALYNGRNGLEVGQITGFSEEANGHGKIIGFAIIFAIPLLMSEVGKKEKQTTTMLLFLSCLTLFISMTRNVLYSLLVCAFMMMLFYADNSKTRRRILQISALFVILILAGMLLLRNNLLPISGRSLEKIEKLFKLSAEDVASDASGGFRLEVFYASLSSWLGSPKSFFFGCGPGQAYAWIQGLLYRVSGNSGVGLLASSGIVGFLSYLFMFIHPFRSAFLSRKRANDIYEIILSEQTMFYGAFLFALDLISSVSYFPIYWIYIALGIYWDQKLNSSL